MGCGERERDIKEGGREEGIGRLRMIKDRLGVIFRGIRTHSPSSVLSFLRLQKMHLALLTFTSPHPRGVGDK